MNIHQKSIVYLVRPALRAALYPYFRMEYEGVENVPRTGAVLLAPNHQAYADPFLIGLPVLRPIHFMTWERPFREPYLRPILRYFQCFPVSHDKPFDKNALKITQELLRAEQCVMIFPEGARTKTGDLTDFKPGAFRVAIKYKVPIVPITLNGAYDSWPLQKKLPRPGKINVYFHPPMVFSAEERDIREVSNEAAAAVRDVIASRLTPPKLLTA